MPKPNLQKFWKEPIDASGNSLLNAWTNTSVYVATAAKLHSYTSLTIPRCLMKLPNFLKQRTSCEEEGEGSFTAAKTLAKLKAVSESHRNPLALEVQSLVTMLGDPVWMVFRGTWL